jgi:hypothetical protein
MKKYIWLPLVFSFCFCLLGCKHDSQLTVSKKLTDSFLLNITVTGNLLIGDTISFTSNASDTCTFLWSFGDGTTSTLAHPTHVYSIIPFSSSNTTFTDTFYPDTVSLSINSVPTQTCTRYLRILPPVSKIAGMHHWRHCFYGGPSGSYTTTWVNDTDFAITQSDSMNFMIGSIDFMLSGYWGSYFSVDSPMILFVNNPDPFNFSLGPVETVSFHYTSDSIVKYRNNDPTALGGTSAEYWISH